MQLADSQIRPIGQRHPTGKRAFWSLAFNYGNTCYRVCASPRSGEALWQQFRYTDPRRSATTGMNRNTRSDLTVTMAVPAMQLPWAATAADL